MKSKEPPSSLDKFKVHFEYDNTISEERKLNKKRIIKDGTGE